MEIIFTTNLLEDSALEHCVNVLRKGNVVCYPTETFYALGIDPACKEARARLYRMKGRSMAKELPLIAANAKMVASICDISDPRFHPLAEKFWPGPLTLVLPSSDHTSTIAVRVSAHPVARQISSALQGPVVSTSANLSGESAVTDPAQLPYRFKTKIQLLIDAGRCRGGLPSTILSLLETPAKILRQGAISPEEIFAII